MRQEVIQGMLAAIRESIERLEACAGAEPGRAVELALAHLWSAYDELEVIRHEVAPASSPRTQRIPSTALRTRSRSFWPRP